MIARCGCAIVTLRTEDAAECCRKSGSATLRGHVPILRVQMIDVFFILFTGGMALYVIFRAAVLDRKEPWFEVEGGRTDGFMQPQTDKRTGRPPRR